MSDAEWQVIQKYKRSNNTGCIFLMVMFTLFPLISYLLIRDKEYLFGCVFLASTFLGYYVIFKSLILVNRDTVVATRECVIHKRRVYNGDVANSRYMVWTSAGSKCMTDAYNYKRINNSDKVLVFGTKGVKGTV